MIGCGGTGCAPKRSGALSTGISQQWLLEALGGSVGAASPRWGEVTRPGRVESRRYQEISRAVSASQLRSQVVAVVPLASTT